MIYKSKWYELKSNRKNNYSALIKYQIHIHFERRSYLNIFSSDCNIFCIQTVCSDFIGCFHYDHDDADMDANTPQRTYIASLIFSHDSIKPQLFHFTKHILLSDPSTFSRKWYMYMYINLHIHPSCLLETNVSTDRTYM